MNMEAQAQAGAAKNEGEEKQAAFEENAARAAAIQQEIAEAAVSGDFVKIAELSAEGQQLKSANESVVVEDHQEGLEMNAEMDAEKSRQEAEAAKIAAEAAAEQTRFAQEAAEKAAADQVAAEKLAAEIKSGGTSEYLYRKNGSEEWLEEKSPLVKVEANPNMERAQEILDWAKSMSEQSRERAQKAKEEGLTDSSTEEDILLNERAQLLFKMNSGYPIFTDVERAVIQERIAEIDSNPAVMGRLQDQGERDETNRVENAYQTVWSFLDRATSREGVSSIEMHKSLERYTDAEQEKIAEMFFNDTTAKLSRTEQAYKVYMGLKGSAFSKKFKELENDRLTSQGYGEFIL